MFDHYSGVDDSIVYNYALKPLAKHLVENYVPMWVAPNVLTLIGLGFSIAGLLPVYYHCRIMSEPAPIWMYVWAAICLFSYQTLDNMDGVQARRTGTSSSFGQLLDHGCDAINATLSTATFGVLIQLGHQNVIKLIVCTYLTFFLTTWDEYHTGELHLATINGADEGITLVWIIYLLTALLGTQIWSEPLAASGIKGGQVILYITYVGAAIACADAVRRVYARFKREVHVPLPPHVTGGFLGALLRMVPVIYISVIAVIWIDSPIAHSYYSPRGNLYVPYGAVGLVFALMICKLILAHICKMPYPAFQTPMLILAFPILNIHLGVWLFGEPYIDEAPAGVYTLIAALICFGHYVYNATNQITETLRIQVLTIPYEGGSVSSASTASASASSNVTV